MAQKKAGVVLIVILIVVAILIIPKQTTLFSAHYEDTRSSCTSYRQTVLSDPDLDCAIPCFEMTSEIEGCVEQFAGYTGYSDNVNQWVMVYSYADACDDYFSIRSDPSVSGYAQYSGLYNCVPSIKEYIDNPVSSCEVLADTDCNGKIDRTELGSAITKYIANTMTRTELGSAIQSWVTG